MDPQAQTGQLSLSLKEKVLFSLIENIGFDRIYLGLGFVLTRVCVSGCPSSVRRTNSADRGYPVSMIVRMRKLL